MIKSVIDLILLHHTLDVFTIENIETHDWFDNRFNTDKTFKIETIFCLKCNILFEKVLYMYKQQDLDGTKWHELTCNEVIIKKILE